MPQFPPSLSFNLVVIRLVSVIVLCYFVDFKGSKFVFMFHTLEAAAVKVPVILDLHKCEICPPHLTQRNRKMQHFTLAFIIPCRFLGT